MNFQQPASSAAPSEGTNSPPRVNIGYRPTLIPTLVDEHRGMVEHLAQVLAPFERGELSTTGKLLDQFKHETITHVYKETTQLYLYLQYVLVDRPDEFAQMRKIRKEMDSIVADTMAFLEKYEALENDRQKQNTFKAEMEALRDHWLRRVETEETLLFPMYQPPVSA